MGKTSLGKKEEITTSLESDKSKSVKEIAASLCYEYIYGIKKDNELKGKYGFALMCLLILQLIITNVVFILVGFKLITYSEFTLNLYMTSTILEVTALVTIIVKHLFSGNKNEIDNVVKEYINKDKSRKSKTRYSKIVILNELYKKYFA